MVYTPQYFLQKSIHNCLNDIIWLTTILVLINSSTVVGVSLFCCLELVIYSKEPIIKSLDGIDSSIFFTFLITTKILRKGYLLTKFPYLII